MRYILSLFLTLALFSAPSFSQKKDSYRVRTIVIDPGHGGNKPGAIGSKTSEKTIVLSIAKKFGKLVADNYPDVKIIYTRTTDVDISLAERAHIANRNKADLFISIHANSHPTSSPTGVETFVMGLSESRANLAVAQKENADILLEADYKENADYKGFDPNSPESYVMLTMFQNAYLDKSLNFAQAIQNQYKQNLKTINRGVKQAELFVLYKTTCPSVLTEVGFISNPAEEAFMMSDEGQAKIAISLFNAFMTFKANEEGTAKLTNPKLDIPGAPKAATPTPATAEKKETPPPAEPVAAAPAQPAETPVAAKPAEPVKPVEPAKPVKPAEPAKPVKPAEPVQQPVVETPQPTTPPRPVPTTELVTPPAAPQPAQPLPATPPANTAAPTATEFFTVQFLSTADDLKSGAPEFQGLTDVMMVRNGKLFCYSVGRFATFAEASEYCKKLQKETPFKDAWALRRAADKVTYLDGTSSTPAAPTTPAAPAAAPTTTATATPAPAATATPAATTPSQSGVIYRVQIFTSKKVLKAGAPELQGIKDFHRDPYGKVYIYSVGNYKSLDEARKRAANIRATTPFKDAFVIGFKNGKKINID